MQSRSVVCVVHVRYPFCPASWRRRRCSGLSLIEPWPSVCFRLTSKSVRCSRLSQKTGSNFPNSPQTSLIGGEYLIHRLPLLARSRIGRRYHGDFSIAPIVQDYTRIDLHLMQQETGSMPAAKSRAVATTSLWVTLALKDLEIQLGVRLQQFPGIRRSLLQEGAPSL